jgi:hypothetical protein
MVRSLQYTLRPGSSNILSSLKKFFHAARTRLTTAPSFTAMRRIYADCNGAWFQNTILGILAPGWTPSLTKALVAYETPLDIDPGFMNALDDALLPHSANPSMIWRVFPHDALDDAVPWMQGMMPKTLERGRLVVETIRANRR